MQSAASPFLLLLLLLLAPPIIPTFLDQQFVDANFDEEGTEFADWEPTDWKENPAFLDNIKVGRILIFNFEGNIRERPFHCGGIF